MEASDVFSGGAAEIGADDPFAGTDFGDFDGDKAAQEAMAEGLPTVDKEGNRLGPDGKPVADPPTPAAPAESAGQTEDPTPAESGGTTGSTTEDPTPAASPEPASSASEEKPGTPSSAGEPSSASTPVPEPEPAAEEAPEPAPKPAEEPAAPAAEEEAPPAAPESAEEPAQTDGSSSEQPAEGDETEEEEAQDGPIELKDDKGRTTHRAYHVLRALSLGKLERVFFYLAEGKVVPKGTEGAKRSSTVPARSAEDALVHGYKTIGAPQDGAMLVAVPHSHFQVKPVKPKPPEPSKTRLQIG